MTAFALVLSAGAMAACGEGARPTADTPVVGAGDSVRGSDIAATDGPPEGSESTMVSLGDSIAWSNNLHEGIVYRIVIVHGGTANIIPSITSSTLPIVIGDSIAYGFHEAEGMLEHGYRYDIQRRRLDTLPLPSDIHRVYAAPSLSPTGEYIAYVLLPGDATGAAMVRKWPGGDLVYQGRSVAVPPSDWAASCTRWSNERTFDIRLDVSPDTWHRERGDVSDVSAVVVDSVGAFCGAE